MNVVTLCSYLLMSIGVVAGCNSDVVLSNENQNSIDKYDVTFPSPTDFVLEPSHFWTSENWARREVQISYGPQQSVLVIYGQKQAEEEEKKFPFYRNECIEKSIQFSEYIYISENFKISENSSNASCEDNSQKYMFKIFYEAYAKKDSAECSVPPSAFKLSLETWHQGFVHMVKHRSKSALFHAKSLAKSIKIDGEVCYLFPLLEDKYAQVSSAQVTIKPFEASTVQEGGSPTVHLWACHSDSRQEFRGFPKQINLSVGKKDYVSGRALGVQMAFHMHGHPEFHAMKRWDKNLEQSAIEKLLRKSNGQFLVKRVEILPSTSSRVIENNEGNSSDPWSISALGSNRKPVAEMLLIPSEVSGSSANVSVEILRKKINSDTDPVAVFSIY